MKKIIFTLCLFMAAQAGFAQSAKSLFDEFKAAPDADYVHVPKILLKLAAKSSDVKLETDNASFDTEIIKKISSITVLDLEECSSDVKQKFSAAVKKLSDKDYEELLRAKDDGDEVRILMKKDKKAITELLIISASDDDPGAVLIKGKMTEKDIDAAIKMSNE